MNTGLAVEVLRPQALGASERDAWTGFVQASAHLQSPFFRFEYAQAAGRAAPGAHVAVIHRAGSIVGFLPFQRRGGALQPLGAPLTDYHGLIAAPGSGIELTQVVRALRADEYRFSGLCAEAPPAGAGSLAAWEADLGEGYAAYLAQRQAEHPRFFKDLRRKGRGMEGEFGPMTLAWERDPALLDWILARKREQYRRTQLHDVFACGWTERLLRELWAGDADGCHGRLGVLRAGGRMVAATFNLHAGDQHYMWFPAYETAAGRWSPGLFLYLKMIEQVAGEGGRCVDFGPASSHGKRFLTTAGRAVHQGRAFGSRWRAAASDATERLLAPAPVVGELRARARRRFDVITACETDTLAWLGGAALAARRMLSGAPPAEMTAN